MIPTAKNRQNPFYEMRSFREGKPPIRIKRAIFVGSVAALAVTTAPVLAKNSTPQKIDDKSTTSSCHAYHQAADGTWMRPPYHKLASGSRAPTQHKPPTRGTIHHI